MKSGDLVRLKPAYELALKLKLGETYLVISLEENYWTVMDTTGTKIRVFVSAEFMLDSVSEVRHCFDDQMRHINR